MSVWGKIAGRYLFSGKSGSVTGWISGISAAGMAVGSAALIIILSVYNGFDSIIRENLKNSEDPGKAVSEAVAQLKMESGYLFETEQTPPFYARGTGSQQGTQESAPATLAEALKEKFYNK